MKLEFSDLYYIPNFKFTDGSTKNKYLLVLSNSDSDSKLILSLPTSIGRVPDHLENGQSGCINCNKSHFNCYRFSQNITITENPPSEFPRDTYVYGEWIQNWNSKSLRMDYSIEDVDYNYLGKLKNEYIIDLLKCFICSIKVKRKFKKVFSFILENLN